MRKLVPLCAMALATLSLSLPSFADARTHHRRHHHRTYHNETCAAHQHRRGTNGAIIGAVGGAIVGNSLARGNRAPGTLLGAGVGALAGNAVGKSSTRC